MEDELRIAPGRIRPERARRGGGGARFRFSRRLGLPGSSFVSPGTRAYLQRSVVKIAYVPNRPDRAWSAHARYLEREGAQREGERGVGFNALDEEVPLAPTVRGWQEGGDELVWKLVVSPERGHRIDLRGHARSLMEQVSEDLQTPLEWVAIEHQNTDNPHVHVLLRGRREDGAALEIDPDYIKHGFRTRSAELATNELGYRTEHDHRQALEREISALRLTSLDRALVSAADDRGRVRVSFLPPADGALAARRRLELGRLQHLRDVGLATKEGPFRWRLEPGFEGLLRELQQAGDIAKRVARDAPFLRERLASLARFEPGEGRSVAGRLIGTGLDQDLYGRSYFLLEGDDGVVYHARQTRRIQEARARGRLRLGDQVVLESVPLGTPSENAKHRFSLAVWRADDVPFPVLAAHRERQQVLGMRALFEQLLLREEGRGVRPILATGWAETLFALAELDRPEARTMDTLDRFETPGGVPARLVRPTAGRMHRGRLIGYATGASAERLAVIDNGRELLGLETRSEPLPVGTPVQATAESVQRRLLWRIDDLERLQTLERSREG